jgi:MFS family permease
MVALVQTATNLPVFLLGIPAGAFADIIDRRRLLIVTQAWMLGAAAILSGLAFAGLMGPWTLLSLTFLLGVGATLNAPAWQAIVPELVPRAELPAAIAINSVGFNVARAIGPALGGLVVAAISPAAAFLLNAISFVGVLVVLYLWKRGPMDGPESSESVASAIIAGLRYARFSPPLHTVLIRSVVFVLSASCLWSLLPIIAKAELHAGSSGYGVLLGCLGAGSILGAFLLTRVRSATGVDGVVGSGVCLFGIATLSLAWLDQFLLVCLFLLLGGVAWMAVMSNFNTAAQTSLPDWVRARGMAVYIFVFQGSMALGSVVWGIVAERFGIRLTMAASGVSLFAGLALTYRRSLNLAGLLDTRPSGHWQDPHILAEPKPDDGPVMVTVEYHVSAVQRSEFLAAMRAVEPTRRRDGAVTWGLFEDGSLPGRYVETFIVDSWAEHIRQHSRATMSDLEIEARARAFHDRDGALPLVTHWISARGR